MNEFIFATVLAASSLAANAQAQALRAPSTSEPIPPRDVRWRHHRDSEPDEYRNQHASLRPPDGPEGYTPAVRPLVLI